MAGCSGVCSSTMSEVIYGRQPVLEVLRAGRREVSSLWMSDVKDSAEISEITRLADNIDVRVTRSKREDVEQLSKGGHHQGVCAQVSGYPSISEGELATAIEQKATKAVVLFLDHILDPQNTGALIRSAECMGLDAVVIPADRAAGITPAVVRASAGATEHMRIAVVVNLVRTMKKLKDAGLWFYGMESSADAKPPWDMDFSDGTGVVVGSEGGGMSRLVRENCDFRIQIPMHGKVSSLNASASGGMVMYEVMKQKGRAAKS